MKIINGRELWRKNEFRRVPLISVVASKRKTGKTTVVTRLVSELQNIGLSVGVVKAISMAFRWIMKEQIQTLSIKLELMRLQLQGLLKQRFVYARKEQSNLYEISQFMPVDIVILETRSQGLPQL